MYNSNKIENFQNNSSNPNTNCINNNQPGYNPPIPPSSKFKCKNTSGKYVICDNSNYKCSDTNQILYYRLFYFSSTYQFIQSSPNNFYIELGHTNSSCLNSINYNPTYSRLETEVGCSIKDVYKEIWTDTHTWICPDRNIDKQPILLDSIALNLIPYLPKINDNFTGILDKEKDKYILKKSSTEYDKMSKCTSDYTNLTTFIDINQLNAFLFFSENYFIDADDNSNNYSSTGLFTRINYNKEHFFPRIIKKLNPKVVNFNHKDIWFYQNNILINKNITTTLKPKLEKKNTIVYDRSYIYPFPMGYVFMFLTTTFQDLFKESDAFTPKNKINKYFNLSPIKFICKNISNYKKKDNFNAINNTFNYIHEILIKNSAIELWNFNIPIIFKEKICPSRCNRQKGLYYNCKTAEYIRLSIWNAMLAIGRKDIGEIFFNNTNIIRNLNKTSKFYNNSFLDFYAYPSTTTDPNDYNPIDIFVYYVSKNEEEQKSNEVTSNSDNVNKCLNFKKTKKIFIAKLKNFFNNYSNNETAINLIRGYINNTKKNKGFYQINIDSPYDFYKYLTYAACAAEPLNLLCNDENNCNVWNNYIIRKCENKNVNKSIISDQCDEIIINNLCVKNDVDKVSLNPLCSCIAQLSNCTLNEKGICEYNPSGKQGYNNCVLNECSEDGYLTENMCSNIPQTCNNLICKNIISLGYTGGIVDITGKINQINKCTFCSYEKSINSAKSNSSNNCDNITNNNNNGNNNGGICIDIDKLDHEDYQKCILCDIEPELCDPKITPPIPIPPIQSSNLLNSKENYLQDPIYLKTTKNLQNFMQEYNTKINILETKLKRYYKNKNYYTSIENFQNSNNQYIENPIYYLIFFIFLIIIFIYIYKYKKIKIQKAGINSSEITSNEFSNNNSFDETYYDSDESDDSDDSDDYLNDKKKIYWIKKKYFYIIILVLLIISILIPLIIYFNKKKSSKSVTDINYTKAQNNSKSKINIARQNLENDIKKANSELDKSWLDLENKHLDYINFKNNLDGKCSGINKFNKIKEDIDSYYCYRTKRLHTKYMFQIATTAIKRFCSNHINIIYHYLNNLIKSRYKTINFDC